MRNLSGRPAMTMTKSSSPHMTSAEVADYLCCSKDTVRRWAREGKLTRIRISQRKVLYRRDEVEALVENNSYRLST